MARGLKFQIWEVEGLYYLCIENKGPDQLRCYRAADPVLVFAYAKKQVFSQRGSFLSFRLSVPESEIRAVYNITTRLRLDAAARACAQHLVTCLTPDNCLGSISLSLHTELPPLFLFAPQFVVAALYRDGNQLMPIYRFQRIV